MESKTPQFDRLFDEILGGLVPHTRVCKWKGKHEHCEGEFEITKEDIEFLKMLRVPAPNFCPTCRRIRRLVHMNMYQLFKRSCNAPEHNEKMISTFSEECPFLVYDYKYFISDEFDPFSFGRNYNEGESPMQTLFNLRKEFPMPSMLNRDPSSVNCEYTMGGRDNKNCYYTSGCYSVEDAWYTGMANKSRNIMDSRGIRDSEILYECLFSDAIYKSSYIYFSSSCTDSMFLFDCRNCTNCFGCVNLRNAKYCVYNKQFSKEDYEEFMQSILPLTRDFLEKTKKEFWSLIKTLPMNGPRNVSSDNVSGVNIINSKNLFDVVESQGSENVRHADGVLSHNSSMDLLFSGGKSSFLYSTCNIGSQSTRVKFSVSCKFCSDCEFIFNSKNLTNCFMCFGLQNKSYCILNKQYEKEEYYKLVDKIKTEMLKVGEYEDGLGLEFSAQSYNSSIGQIALPLTDEQIIKLGGYVSKDPEINLEGINIMEDKEVPQTIDEVDDNIVDKAIVCEITGRPFRIVASELAFLRRMGMPLPVVHPMIRMRDRIAMSPNGRKYKTVCMKCNKNIETIFNPKDGYIQYCEKCYQQEVY